MLHGPEICCYPTVGSVLLEARGKSNRSGAGLLSKGSLSLSFFFFFVKQESEELGGGEI